MTRSKAISITAVLFYFTGSLGLSFLPITAYTVYTGVLPSVWAQSLGLRGASFGFVELLPFQAAIALGFLFFAISMLEILVGNWLWKSRKRGGKLGLVLLPMGAMLSIATILPIWIVAYMSKGILLAVGWETLN